MFGIILVVVIGVLTTCIVKNYYIPKEQAKSAFTEYVDNNLNKKDVTYSVYYSFKTDKFQADGIDQQTGVKFLLYFDADGNVQIRWFNEQVEYHGQL